MPRPATNAPICRQPQPRPRLPLSGLRHITMNTPPDVRRDMVARWCAVMGNPKPVFLGDAR